MCECDLISYNDNSNNQSQSKERQSMKPRFLQGSTNRTVQRAIINATIIGGDNATNRVSDKERKEVPS